jgi:serine phosphatase RsbU (regulator of sigma subunit)
MIYTFTDGFADQFGGEKGKKFKYSQLKNHLIGMSDKPIKEQKSSLDATFESWKGYLEQVDDVCVIGVRI